MATALTEDIRVSVKSDYKPQLSSPHSNEFLFAYQIHIENLGETTVQLLSRHWHILDAMGFERVVEGEGVIGVQPVIGPGEGHAYSSSCHLSTPFGSMEGYYVFIREPDSAIFRARIPKFRLEVPFLLS